MSFGGELAQVRFIGVLSEGWGPPPCHVVVVVARGGELEIMASMLVTSAMGSR